MKNELYFNGIDAHTGRYAFAPQNVADLARQLRGEPRETGSLFLIKLLLEYLEHTKLSPIAGVDANKICEAGWGVVFPAGMTEDAPARRGLRALLHARKDKADKLYKELEYRPMESSFSFSRRYGAFNGPVNPEKIPYHLLIVGDPETIPFELQYNLDIQHAVGRVYFEKEEEYARYAENALRADSMDSLESVRTALFGTRHDEDLCTELSSRFLVENLGRELANVYGNRIDLEMLIGTDATKANLSTLLSGSSAPHLFLAATHGLILPKNDPRQKEEQGAMICAEWGGPAARNGRPLRGECYLSAADLDEDGHFEATIGFLFGCYSGGTPKFDNFPSKPGGHRRQRADRAFLSRLPMRMLGRKGGCAAVIAHVDCAYLWSIADFEGGEQTGLFRDCFRRLLKGETVGRAMDTFHVTYAERRAQYEEQKENEQSYPPSIYPRNDNLLTNLWLAVNDARNYLLLGDPAVRLMVRETGGTDHERQ